MTELKQEPRNSYYLCWPNRREAWNPLEGVPHPHWTRTRYFSGVFTSFDAALRTGGLTVYLTANHTSLPTYGKDVVAVLQEDQPSRVPRYFDRVLATFTCHGIRQSFRPNPLRTPSYTNLLSAAVYARNLIRRLPSRLRYHWHNRRRDARETPIYTIPLGYANQVNLPIKPIEERTTDVFFAGSIAHSSNPTRIKRLFGTPKYHSRKNLVSSLKSLQRCHSDLSIDLDVKTTFQESMGDAAGTYSQRMMDAKICPVPRGTSLESYRFFEALRFGCIPIVEALPSRRFYDEAPLIRVDRWSELEQIVPALLNNQRELRRTHKAVLDWWNSRCSEHAVGRYMAEKINRLTKPDHYNE